MWKLRKFFKPYTAVLIGIVVLLFTQAMADLTLPEYMARIVNNGIQSGGIEEATLEILSEEQYEGLLLFMEDADAKAFANAYTLLQPSDETYAKQTKKFVGLEAQPLYVLGSVSEEQREELAQITAKAMMMDMVVTTPGSQVAAQILANVPAGTTIQQALAMMPEAQLESLVASLSAEIEKQEASILESAGMMAVSNYYENLGVAMDTYQMNYIYTVGAQMLALTLLGAIATVLVGLLASRVAAGFGRDARKAVFGHVTNFSNQEFDQFSTASLITRSTNDITQIQTVMVMMLRFVIYAPIMGVGGILKVMGTQSALSWIIIVGLVSMIVLIGFLFVVALPKFQIVQTLLDKLNLVTRESLTGMLVIRAFANEESESKKFDAANQAVTKVNLFVNRAMAIMMPMMMFIMNVLTIMIVWFGAQRIDLGTMQVGDMMAFMQYTMQVIMSFFSLSMVFIMLPRATVSANRIAEVLDTPLSVLEPQQAVQLKDAKGLIEFKNVRFAYPHAQEDILHDISFTAKPGQTTAFIGSTGSGKSTIINLVPRFYDVSGGEILLDGVNIKDLSTSLLRDQIGYVPQKGLLFSGTIASNLRFANENLDDASLLDVASIAQASDFISQKDLGLAEPIAQGGTNVSGGQKQRLSIARALAKRPNVLIFDDSFSALDFKTDKKLRQALSENVKDATILLVGQRVASIMNADQIIVLDEGSIVGVGTHDSLMQTCDVYQEIAASQLSKEELAHA
ncbi:MAG: ABC transporter ATP-binding protein [Erysipelotrichaceae bacterium]